MNLRTRTFEWILLGVVVALAACQKTLTDPVERGQAYFDALGCAKCHMIGENGGTWGPNLTFIGTRKSKDWLDMWLKDPHSWNKKTVMPNFHLTDEARGALVAYLAEQKGQAWGENRPWKNHPDMTAVQRGEILFNKAGCVACHAQNGRGGYPNNNVVGGQIPSLTKVAEGYTKEELMNKIRNGVTPAPADPGQPAPMIFMPKWGEVLKADEISDVADFLISLDKHEDKKSKDAW